MRFASSSRVGAHGAIDARQRHVWIDENGHVVGHDDPGAEIMELEHRIRVMQRRCHTACYPVVFQPRGTGLRFV